MTPEKVIEVIETYRRLFVGMGIGKIDYPHNQKLNEKMPGLEHCHGMLDKMIAFVHEGRLDKAFRWLGFVQGVLWATGIFPLTDLKNHNRPSETEKEKNLPPTSDTKNAQWLTVCEKYLSGLGGF